MRFSLANLPATHKMARLSADGKGGGRAIRARLSTC